MLSDGTKVHLNAMTSLRFPVTFDNGPRKVELEGEAYFEVCKTGQPFIVCTQGMQVEVLGTTFNISAYPQEEYQTTLVNGSVKVNGENHSTDYSSYSSTSNTINARTSNGAINLDFAR